MIVASADSSRQTKALARNVHDKVKAGGGSVIGIEGEQTGEWVLVDVGDIVVHIMQPGAREYYNLEQLWGGATPCAAFCRCADPASTALPTQAHKRAPDPQGARRPGSRPVPL